MGEHEDEYFVCPKCNNEVHEDDDFCTHCGELFSEEIPCSFHEHVRSTGVCIICARPCCDECGGLVGSHFLCGPHASYEIFGGMVRVDAALDDASAQSKKSCLEHSGLHPLLLCRRDSIRGSRPRYTPYDAASDQGGDGADEIKVMVPCGEVEEAEKALAVFFPKPFSP